MRTPSMSVAECEALIGPRPLRWTKNNIELLSSDLTPEEQRQMEIDAHIEMSENPPQNERELESELITEDELEDELEPPVELEAPKQGTQTGSGWQLETIIRSIVDESLANGSVNEARVIDLIKKHGDGVSHRVITLDMGDVKRKLPERHYHELFPLILKLAHARLNVCLVGPAGGGKSTIGDQVAKAMELPFYLVAPPQSPFELTGYRDAEGNYRDTPFRRGFEHGGVVLWEEFDSSDNRACTWANTATANGHADFPDGCVKRHPNFILIACGNTWGKGADRQYVGRNPIDAATLDRFFFVNFDYDEKLERALCGNDEWCDFVQAVRRAVDRLKLKLIVSPRASINGAIALAAGVSRSDVELGTIWKGCDKDTIVKIRESLRG